MIDKVTADNTHHMNSKTKALISLHVSLVLIGASGLFAKLVSTSALFLVFGRVVFAAAVLGCILAYRKKLILPRNIKAALPLFAMGALLTFHWLAFFHGIQLSSVAIGVLTLMTFPVFITVLEPVLMKKPFHKADVLSVFLCCIGVWLVVPKEAITQGQDMIAGAIWGVLAGLSYAFILLMHKRYIDTYSATQINFYQCFVVMVILLPAVLWVQEDVLLLDWFYVFLHGVIFTALAFTLYVGAAKHLSAQVISISSMLEILYGIILAWIILDEQMEAQMALGGALILLAAYMALRTQRA